MEKEIQNKVQRFVELSKQFSKSEYDLFPQNNGMHQFSTISSGTCYGTINVNSNQNELTRTEKLQQELTAKIQKSKDYDEYLGLQKDLSEYFSAVNKLQ